MTPCTHIFVINLPTDSFTCTYAELLAAEGIDSLPTEEEEFNKLVLEVDLSTRDPPDELSFERVFDGATFALIA